MSAPGGRVDYDVVVVGARCAGAAVAMLLARGGLSVLLVDRARYGTDTLSTHALTLPAVRQLSRWGVLDGLRAAGTPVINRVVYEFLGRDGTAETVDLAVGPRADVDGLYAPRRYLLDRLLVDAAVRAGAEVRHRVGMRQVWTEGGRVVGVRLDQHQSRRRGLWPVRARMVIGADGAGSAVARQVGAEAWYEAPHSSATVYTYVGGLPADAYRNYFRPGAGAGLIPTNDGLANVWVSVPMDRLRQAASGAGPGDRAGWFARMLAGAAPELAAWVGEGADSGRYATFTGRRGFARRCWGPGWALVGDAGYFKDPISAHGMTDALIGADLLARAVLAAHGAGPERADEPAALGGYARQRARLIAPMIPAVAHLASFRWDVASLQRSQRAINAAMRTEWEFLDRLDGPHVPG